MRNKHLRVLLALLMSGAINGCGYVPSPGTINQTTEVLEEGSFRFRYPIDWKITTEEKIDEQGKKIAVYNFRHPQTRACYITIEWTKYPSTVNRSNHINEIIAEKTRLYKKTLSGFGYSNFTFTTSHVTFANRDAVKAVFWADRSAVTREIIVRIAPYKNDYYAITYQAYSSWNAHTRNRLEEIVQSFQFVR